MAHAVARSVWLLPGEAVRKDAAISGGRLLLTGYRLLFIGSVAETTWSVPLSLIAKVEVLDLSSLKFTSKLGLSFACEFVSENECECWLDRIQQVVFKPGLDKDSFCFLFHDALCARIPDHPFLQWTNKLFRTGTEKTSTKPSLALDLCLSSGFNIVHAEYTRMKFGCPWRITHANGSFRICSSYPEYHIVPSDIEDSAIARMSEFRTHKRFPSVVWRSQTTGAVLLRTSEPRVGWMYNRNECDEQFMSSVSRSCMKDPGLFPPKAPTRLLIVDARTFRVAQLKRFLGGGYEYSGYYNEAELCFMDMPNLHAVRVSFERLSQLYAMETDANWFSTLEKTCWLNYISQLLKSSLDIAVAMESVGRPVMVHCTDGWDRTAQLSSLAQLLADPYYRTIEGFVILVEREWLQFGHKFADRCGHGDSYPSGDERSPIFLQWLDCVHQVRIQFPDQFEFNETFLVKLGLHVYSGMFGTFLCNSERSRQEADLDSRTCSVWALLSHRYNWTTTNQFYEPSKQRLLEPDWRFPSLRLWNSLYRSALLPTRRITTGVVTLNSSPANFPCSTLSESDSHVDQQASAPLRPARASSPEINSCGGFSPADRLLGADVCDGCGMLDLADENLTVNSLSHGSPVQLNTVSGSSPSHTYPVDITDAAATLPVSHFANDSFGVFTNECDADTRLSSSCCGTFKDGSAISNGYEQSVAILPLSSVTDDTVQPPSFRNVHFLSDFVSTSVVAHSRTDQVVARSLSPSDGLVLGERRFSFERPCSRNCSISTNEDGGVFVVDDELAHAVPRTTGTVLNADSHLSHTFDRSCNLDDDDDGEAIRWDGCCPSQSGYPVDKATSPISINSRSSGGGGAVCRVTLDQGAILASENPIEYQSLRPPAQRPENQPHSTDQINGVRDCHDLSTKAFVPSFCRHDLTGPSANHVSGATGGLSIDAADYTMHSLPEEELLLINETVTDHGRNHVPMDSTSRAVGGRCSTGLSVANRDAPTASLCTNTLDLSAWKGVYFTPHYLSSPSGSPFVTHRATVQHAATNPCVFDSTRSLTINPNAPCASEVRPVSAPTSPVAGLDLAPSCQYLLRVSPVGATSPPSTTTCTPAHLSPPLPVLRPKEHGNCCPSVSSCIDPVLLPFDWDGLPLSVDLVTRRRHAREQLERLALERQVSELTEKLRVAYNNLAEAVAEIERTKRATSTVLLPPPPPPLQPDIKLASIATESAVIPNLPAPSNATLVSGSSLHQDLSSGAIKLHELVDGNTVQITPDTCDGIQNAVDSESHTFEVIDSVQTQEPVHECLVPSQLQTDTIGLGFLHQNILDTVFQPVSTDRYSPNQLDVVNSSDTLNCTQSLREETYQSELLAGNAPRPTPVTITLTEATGDSEISSDQTDSPRSCSIQISDYPAHSTPLKLRSAIGLLPAVSVSHLPVSMVPGSSSARCRSAGNSRCTTSPATPDGVAQA